MEQHVENIIDAADADGVPLLGVLIVGRLVQTQGRGPAPALPDGPAKRSFRRSVRSAIRSA